MRSNHVRKQNQLIRLEVAALKHKVDLLGSILREFYTPKAGVDSKHVGEELLDLRSRLDRVSELLDALDREAAQ